MNSADRSYIKVAKSCSEQVPGLNFRKLHNVAGSFTPLRSPKGVAGNVSPYESDEKPTTLETPLQYKRYQGSPLMRPRAHSDLSQYASRPPVIGLSTSSLSDAIKLSGVSTVELCSHRRPCPPSLLAAEQIESEFKNTMSLLSAYVEHIQKGKDFLKFEQREKLLYALENEAKYGAHVSPMLAALKECEIPHEYKAELRELIMRAVPK